MEEESMGLVKKKEDNRRGINKWKILAIILMLIIIGIVIFFVIKGRDTNKYKIKLHYGNEIIDIDEDFDLSKLEVEGGEVTFIVDSEGNIVPPGEKLSKDEEYSAHLIPQGKEKVKVTYINDKKIFSIYYQKGAGLLLPKATAKKGLAFIGWFNEETNSFPNEKDWYRIIQNNYSMVNKTLKKIYFDRISDVRYIKPKMDNGVCTLNCDTNNDGKCDLNCDINGDETPDTNLDKDGDGKADTNLKPDGNKICTLNCDTNNDGTPDTNKDTNGNGNPDTNIDVDGDGTPEVSIDTNGDGKCDKDCIEEGLITRQGSSKSYYSCTDATPMALINKGMTFVYLIIDGKNISESDFVDKGDYKVYNYGKDYMGSGKTISFEYKLIMTDKTGQKYYCIWKRNITFEGNCEGPQLEYTLTLDPNGGEVSPTSMVFYKGQNLSDLPFPTRKGYQFVGWFTLKEGGELITNESKMPEKDMTIYAQWESNDTPKETSKPTSKPKPTATPKPKATATPKLKPTATPTPKPTATPTTKPQDNGTISLSAANTCVIDGHRVNITATVTNALDDTVKWTADRCITINGSGKTITVIPDGCGSTAKITGTLNNGKSSSVTLKIEDSLKITVKTRYGTTPEYANGAYLGNDLVISSNIPAYFTGSGISSSSSLRTSVTTNGTVQAHVTIKTPCGQTKSINTYPVIN